MPAFRVYSPVVQDERHLIRNFQPPAERVIFIRPKHRASPHLRNVAHHDRFGYANVLRHVSRYALGDRDNAISSASQPTLQKYAKVENIGERGTEHGIAPQFVRIVYQFGACQPSNDVSYWQSVQVV